MPATRPPQPSNVTVPNVPHLARELGRGDIKPRRAVGYVRVSTDMQAADGLSLDAQTAAIEQYASLQGLKLQSICKDVISGAKSERPGLPEALESLQRGTDVLVVLKFDRLSRSIKHFCELYETYFQSGEKELVAIRESIRLDSSLGRALVSILLVFAQMEREATAERTREALSHIRRLGYHHGKAPYGFKAVPAPDQPRFKLLIEDPEEQKVLGYIKGWLDADLKVPDIAARLDSEGIEPPQTDRWRTSFLYLLIERHGWHTPQPHNERSHTDEQLLARIVELRGRGHTYPPIAKGHAHWWPAQVQQLLEGRFDSYYPGSTVAH